MLQGPAQIRQSFAKRKRGLAQKAYQLHRIADAKVSLHRWLLPPCHARKKAAFFGRMFGRLIRSSPQTMY